MKSVHVSVQTPDGEPLGSWTTTEDGEHIPDVLPPHQLTFNRLTQVNGSRVAKWHPGFPGGEGWVGSDWSNAAAGEMGEACNVVKKLRRDDIYIRGKKDPSRKDLLAMLGEEMADTIIYLDLLAQYYDIDLPKAIIDKFNSVSVREGFEERL